MAKSSDGLSDGAWGPVLKKDQVLQFTVILATAAAQNGVEFRWR